MASAMMSTRQRLTEADDVVRALGDDELGAVGQREHDVGMTLDRWR
jgi:hypothetical protein